MAFVWDAGSIIEPKVRQASTDAVEWKPSRWAVQHFGGAIRSGTVLRGAASCGVMHARFLQINTNCY
jgi:hypothetical protein